MADVKHFITKGIGLTGGVPFFIRFGLDSNNALATDLQLTLRKRDTTLTLKTRNVVLTLRDR